MNFKAFEKKALEANLVATDRGNGHWQVKGKLLVNFYPHKGTVYIAGMTKGLYAENIEEVFKATGTLPEIGIYYPKEDRKQMTNYKRKLYKRTQACYMCSKVLTYKEATVDHFIPISKGGLNNMNNFRLACEPCNSAKGNTV